MILLYNAGSVYCDNEIRNSGAIGEHVQSGSVLVVKTHRESLRLIVCFEAAVEVTYLIIIYNY